jgi:hypothetical protein
VQGPEIGDELSNLSLREATFSEQESAGIVKERRFKTAAALPRNGCEATAGLSKRRS